MTSNNVEKHS